MSGQSWACAIRDETRTICGDVIFYLSFVAAHHRCQSAGFGRLEPRSATESLTEICAASVGKPSCELDCSKEMRGGSDEGGQRCIRWRDKEGRWWSQLCQHRWVFRVLFRDRWFPGPHRLWETHNARRNTVGAVEQAARVLDSVPVRWYQW
jgi:hypothetical protein